MRCNCFYIKKSYCYYYKLKHFFFKQKYLLLPVYLRLWVADKQLRITQKVLHFHYQLLTNSSRQSCGGRRQAASFKLSSFLKLLKQGHDSSYSVEMEITQAQCTPGNCSIVSPSLLPFLSWEQLAALCLEAPRTQNWGLGGTAPPPCHLFDSQARVLPRVIFYIVFWFNNTDTLLRWTCHDNLMGRKEEPKGFYLPTSSI